MLPTCWAYYIHTVTDKTSVIWHSMYYGTYHTLHSSASTAEYVAPAGGMVQAWVDHFVTPITLP